MKLKVNCIESNLNPYIHGIPKKAIQIESSSPLTVYFVGNLREQTFLPVINI